MSETEFHPMHFQVLCVHIDKNGGLNAHHSSSHRSVESAVVETNLRTAECGQTSFVIYQDLLLTELIYVKGVLPLFISSGVNKWLD